MFLKVETNRYGRVEIPVFTGMTVFGAVLRNGGIIRRFGYQPAFQSRLSNQAGLKPGSTDGALFQRSMSLGIRPKIQL